VIQKKTVGLIRNFSVISIQIKPSCSKDTVGFLKNAKLLHAVLKLIF